MIVLLWLLFADPPAPSGNDPAALRQRIGQNLGKADGQLQGQEVGPPTREVQEQILRDLDELIRKLNDQPPPPPMPMPPPMPNDGPPPPPSGQPPMPQGGGGQSKPQPQGGQSQPQPQSGQPQPGPGQPGAGQAGGKSRREQRAERKQQQQQGKSGGSPQPAKPDPMAKAPMAGQPGEPNGTMTTPPPPDADAMLRDLWGHLPEKVRQEMRQYYRERAMPKYRDLVHEYYNRLAEQGKAKP